MLEGKSFLTDEEMPVPEDTDDDTSLTSDICDQYYGAKKLHLYDAEGHRVEMDPDEEEEEELEALDAEADAELEAEHTVIMDEPELDVDAEFDRIIAEEKEEAEEQADAE